MSAEAVINKPLEGASEQVREKKKENLKQRAYLNSLTSIIDFAGTQITGFIVSPFIVGGLGSSMYGIWQMLNQMTGYANMADTRATQVLKWTIAKKKDVAPDEELRSDVSSAFAVTMFIVPLVLIAGGVISWYAPSIARADAEHHNLIRITCSLLILSLVISKVFDLFESVLRGMNLSFKRMGVRAAIVVVGGGLKVFVITQGYGLIGLSIVQVLIALFIGISFYSVVKKSVAWFGFGKTDRKKVLEFGKLSGWYLADTGVNVLSSNSDKILLGFIGGPAIVSLYALTMFLPLAFQGLVNKVVLGVMPGIGKLLGLQEYEKINKAWRNINHITFLLTTASGVTIILFNQSFLGAWVGEGYFAGNISNILIMVLTIQETFIKHDSYIISTTLDLRKRILLTFLSGLLFIALGFLLIDKFGIAGLCAGLLIGKLLLFIGQRNILRKKIQCYSIVPLFTRVQPLLASLGMLGMAGYLSTIMHPVGLVQLILFAPVTFILSFLIFYFIGLGKEHKNELSQISSSIKFLKPGESFKKS